MMRSYPPFGNRITKAPSALLVVPWVVFCANTDAPASGCREAESTTLPPMRNVFWADNVMKQSADITRASNFFIKDIYLAYWPQAFFIVCSRFVNVNPGSALRIL